MDKSYRFLFYMVCLLTAGIFPHSLYAQAEVLFMNFESYESTPYFFRYGNQGTQTMNNYKPRWVYSHEVIENPVKNGNSSSNVLEYKTMEARDYGLKFRFVTPISLDNLNSISFKIYQPANVLGKPVDTQYNSGLSPANKQQITVKLLSYFNSVCDFRSEHGVLLNEVDFTKENEWITFRFTFNKNNFSTADLNKFGDGIKGFVILPTQQSMVTLAESNIYTCYIDDISINDQTTLDTDNVALHNIDVYHSDGYLHLPTPGGIPVNVFIYELSGILNTCFLSTSSTVALKLENKPYIVKIETEGKIFRKTIYARN